MLQWIELLTKQFNNSQAACEVGFALRLAAAVSPCRSELLLLFLPVVSGPDG